MEFKKYSWDDFFAFNDETPLNQFETAITRMEKTYVDMKDVVVKANERIAESQELLVEQAKTVLKAVESTQAAQDGSAEAMSHAAKSTAELAAEMKVLRDAEAANNKQIAEFEKQLSSLSATKEKAKKVTDGEKGSLRELEQQLASAIATYKSYGEATDKSVKAEQIKRIKELSEQHKTASAALNEAKKSATVAAGSYNELNSRVIAAKKQLKEMEGGLENQSAEFKELQKFVAEGTQKLKDWDKEIGDNQRNVGDYEGALKRLKTEFKLAQDEMIAMAQAFGTESQEFIDAAAKAGALKDEIGDLTDAAKTLAGSPLENMSSALGDVFGKLKAGDFSGAVDSARQFAKAGKSITFKEAGTSLKQFGQTIGIVGKAILTNPLFLLAAVVIGIAVALYKLRDSLIPVKIAMDALGKAIGFVVDLLKDFSDWLGISQFGLEEQTKAAVENAKKTIEVQTMKYDRMIELAEAEGKAVMDLEKAKLRAIMTSANRAITALRIKQKTVLGLNEEEKKDLEDLTKAYDDAYQQLRVLNAKAVTDYKKSAEEKLKAERAALIEVRKLRLQSAIDTQAAIAANEENDFNVRLAAIMKAEKLRNQLILLERDRAVKEANGIVYKEVAAREEANRQIVASAKKREDDQIALLLQTEKKIREINKRIMESYRSEELSRLNQEIYISQLILKNEDSSLSDRLAALSEAADAQQRIIELTGEKELDAAREAADARIKVSRETFEKIFADASLSEAQRLYMLQAARDEAVAIDEAYQNDVIRITGDMNNKIAQLNRETAEAAETNVFQVLARDADRLNAKISTETNNALDELNKQLAAGTVSVEYYQNQRNIITANGMRKQLEAQLDFLERELALTQDGSTKRIRIEEQIAAVRRELSDQTADHIIANEERLRDAVAQIQNESFALAQTLFEAGIQRNIEGLESRLAKEEEIKNKSLAIVGDDAQARAFIEQEYANKRDQIERQIAAQKRKQAIFQKATDATQTVISTAKGVASAVAESPLTFGLPWSAFVAITGALQLARILSAPIPQFYTGTDYSPEGLIRVGDKKGREIVIDPSGNAKLYEQDSVIWAKRGSKVIPNYKTERILAEMENSGVAQELVFGGYGDLTDRLGTAADAVLDSDGIRHSIDDMKFAVVDAIQSQPQHVWDEKGHRIHEGNVNARVQRLDKRYKLIN
jgi:hypothetical protein